MAELNKGGAAAEEAARRPAPAARAAHGAGAQAAGQAGLSERPAGRKKTTSTAGTRLRETGARVPAPASASGTGKGTPAGKLRKPPKRKGGPEGAQAGTTGERKPPATTARAPEPVRTEVWLVPGGGCTTWHAGTAPAVLETMDPGSVAAAVTHLPPFQRRVPRVGGALGGEPDIAGYTERAVSDLDGLKRVLRPDGSLWVVAEDTYYPATGRGKSGNGGRTYERTVEQAGGLGENLPRKSLCLMPWRFATAMAAAEWTVRAVIHRRRAEGGETGGAADRPGRTLTPVFLFTLQPSYRWSGELWTADAADDLWEVPTGLEDEHTAARCLALSGIRPGETVADPFAGGGAMLQAALAAGAKAVGIENDPGRRAEAKRRLTMRVQRDLPWPNASTVLKSAGKRPRGT